MRARTAYTRRIQDALLQVVKDRQSESESKEKGKGRSKGRTRKVVVSSREELASQKLVSLAHPRNGCKVERKLTDRVGRRDLPAVLR